MAITRDDRWLTDAQGRALAGAAVYYCTQPATTSSIPPSPLATIYSDFTTVGTNPVYTDGYGHAYAYVDDIVLYTLVYVHPLFGFKPVILADQVIGGGGAGGLSNTPFAGTPSGTIDGVNKTFTLMNGSTALTSEPTSIIVWCNFPLIKGLGFIVSGPTITFANAPSTNDTIYAQGFYQA